MEPSTYMLAGGLIFAISFVFAMLGLGGGMLYVPVFKWLEIPLKTIAIPLGLLLNGLNTLLAFIHYTRQGLVDFHGGAPAAIAALVLAPVGAWCVRFVPTDLLIILFAVAVLIASIRALTRKPAKQPGMRLSRMQRILIGAGTGGIAGFAGGLLGLGGGFIIAPMFMEMGYEPKQAAATTAFVVTFSSFSGFLGHMAEGRIDPMLAIVCVIMVVLGSQAGAWFMANRAKPHWVTRLYGLVLLGVAAKLLYGALG